MKHLEEQPIQDTETLEHTENRLVELKDLFSERMRGKTGLLFFQQMGGFVDELREELDEDTLKNTQLWHVVGGSNMKDLSSLPYFDVPGDKIEKFIRGVN